MERYSDYKPSGIEWIGDVPQHWIKSKNKFLMTDSDDRVGEKWTDFTLLSLTKRGVIERDVESGKGKFPESFEDYKKVNPEDLIFCLYDIEETPRTVGLSYLRGMITGSYKVFRTDNLNTSKFLYYFYLTIDDFKGLKPHYTGLRNVVRPETFKGLDVFLPPLPEQEEIVRYLDTKTHEIDQLVSITRKKIDLLKERRTSTINEVVTKGLNPNVELKDGGVEWIGEVPSHWRLSSLGFHTVKIGSGSTPRGGSEVYVEKGIPFIRSQNVHFDGLKLEDVSYIDQGTHESMSGSKVFDGDVLLNITGGSIGRCCVVTDIDLEMNVNQHVSIIRTKSTLDNRYLNLLLSSDLGQTQVFYNVTGGNRDGLTNEGIRSFKVTLPPLPEQEEIVRYLDTKTQEIDQLVSIEEKRIETLKEYRQSLISEVVTGKVKVTSTEPIYQEG